MEKYEIIKEVGRGSYGVVWHAINLHTRQHVAIKKLNTKYYKKSEYMKELNSLKKMNNHPYIVKLIEAIRQNDTVFFIFEYMQGSLFNRMASRQMKPFSEIEVRNLCFQVLQGLAYMHSNGYFHRDLKPENLLVLNDMIKIGDLGSVRETNDQSPYTYNVTTLWYRAPEVFLHAPCYDSAVDMWTMGAVMAELFTFRPLFKGDSEADVMLKICSVLGTPTEKTWLAGVDLPRNMYYRFPEFPGVRFCDLIPWASLDAVNLISSLLSWDPLCRPTAMEALHHPFFHDCCLRVPPNIIRFEETTSDTIAMEMRMLRNIELLLMQSPTSTLESCPEKVDPSKDPIGMLPENPFDFMK